MLNLLSAKGFKGKVIKTFTVSRIVERLAQARQQEIIETPVGFKYIVDAMLAGDVLIGGEESGGIGVVGHLPERDGLANSLLLLEAMAHFGEDLGSQFAKLEKELNWQHSYDRLDLHLQGNLLKERVMEALSQPLGQFAGREVTRIERLDGVKLNFSDAWLMFRASGTEPVLRIYCEAPSPAKVTELLGEAEQFVQGFEV
ncbi:MAG: hypothetical protein R2880_21070 [Deinococcales bacterium]